MLFIFTAVIIAYLLGSIPTSVWIGRWLEGIDLREHGSGNAGATNAFRILGVPIGITVLLLDMAKGYAAVSLSLLQHVIKPGSESWLILRIGLGMFAIVGHIYPVFAGFKGGKGVATMTGIGLAIHPLSALCAVGVYGIVFLISKISSLGSLVAVITYPVWIFLVFQVETQSLRIFSMIVSLLVILTHRSNIRRLFRRNEA